MRVRALVIGIVVGWLLACGGAGSPDAPPYPQPKPKPEAPNAGECASWQGATLPLAGGTITACAPDAVTIAHTDGQTSALRWEYARKLEAAGWRLGDPKRGALTLSRSGRTALVTDDGDAVTMRLQ